MDNKEFKLYNSTFSYCGIQFLDNLVRELAELTNSHTCILLQLLSTEEYKQLLTIYPQTEGKCNVISRSSSPEGEEKINEWSDHYLMIRSIYSTKMNHTKNMKPNSIIPISLLNTNSPFIKTLSSSDISNPCIIQDPHLVEEDIYPLFKQFIGIQLTKEKKERNGILCVMSDDQVEDRDLLFKVSKRCINELNQTSREEQLTIARDLAILDAENKLKFLADMSHEIRTPMNAVIALTDLLLQERLNLNSEQVEHLELIQTSGNHILTIVNDILDISKLNHDPKFKLETRRFSLRKCLKDSLSMARHQAAMNQHNKAVYVLECPPDKDDNIPLPQFIQQLEASGILLKPFMHKKGKTVLPIIWRIDSDVPDHLLGDTMRLTQIILNLLSNAVKFTKQGGIYIRIKRSMPTPRTPQQQQQQQQAGSDKRMTFKERYDAKIETIWTRAMQERKDSFSNKGTSPTTDDDMDYFSEKAVLEISVTDTGIGIPADRLPKLFKSFSQIDISTARRYGGTGLGLAISSTLVNRMGGCVWVESEEGVGSRFALTLPMTVAPRGRHYSSDSNTTPTNCYMNSPSSPSSTISDSSSHSNPLDIVSPLPTLSNPTYFSSTSNNNHSNNSSNSNTNNNNNNNNTNFIPAPHPHQRPLLTRAAPHQLDEVSDSPMAEDTQALDGRKNNNTNTGSISIMSAAGNNNNNNNSTSSRANIKPYARKPQGKEENLAKVHPLRILLAEDNILNQKIAISILKRLGYIDVVIANNGKEVLSLMKNSVFDVIFMDLYMPEMDGLEVTREIIKERSKENSELLNCVDVYIIALTASASREDRQICIDAGMNDFISKPFTMVEMKSALKTCANNRKKRRKLVVEKDDPMIV